MKILHVIPSLGIGGTEKMLYELCRGLDAQRFKCGVVALKSGGAAGEKLSGLGVPVEVLGSPDGFVSGVLALPGLYARLKSSIRKSAPDIVHTWLTRANVLGRCAARAAGVPRVVSSLRVMEVEKGYHLLAERWTSRQADAITVNAAPLKDFAVQRIGLPEEKIHLISNGIDVSRAPDTALVETYRKQWAGPGRLLIGAVGRLHRQKGMDVLLEAAAHIVKAHPNAHFLIAGDGPERARLEAQAARLGIQASVTFCGWVKGSLEFISLLDIFALPSRWEGMPNAVMEAMLMGKPVIASRVSGVPELIQHETDGMIVRSEDVGALSQVLSRLINDAAFRAELGRAARQKISSQFDLKTMVTAYETLYQSLQR